MVRSLASASLGGRRTRSRRSPQKASASGRSRAAPPVSAEAQPKPERCINQNPFRTPLHSASSLTLHTIRDILTSMPTSHFYYVYILWDASTHSHFYVGHTSDLAARLKTHNAGHVPHTSKFTPWEIHSAIAVQTEQQASALEQYLKSHSGREWVIKHLGLPVGMKSAN